MPPNKPGVTNFRTYEAQARLLAAVIATAKPKLDYKAIAKHIGSDASSSSVDHRLRPMKQLAKLQERCVKEGKDPANLPFEKGEIQKLFGESTAGGLEFHFREVKATGKAQQDAVEAGNDPKKVPIGPQTRHVNGKPKGKPQNSAPNTPATSRKRNAPASGLATTGGRGRKQQRVQAANDESDEDSPEEDYDELDLNTPTKLRTYVARDSGHAVNTSATSSEVEDSLALSKPYVHSQHENTARDLANFQQETFQSQAIAPLTYAAQSARPGADITASTQHIGFAGSTETLAPASGNQSAHRTGQLHDDDDIQEINSNQFSVARNGLSNSHTETMSVESIKKDPFDTSDTASDYVDLTKTAMKRQSTAQVSHSTTTSSSYPRKYGWSNPHYADPYADTDYGDGEI